jgi:NADPH-dependent 2,4-dienoyl-CoA reductase/sulfur reductase-like enzyme
LEFVQKQKASGSPVATAVICGGGFIGFEIATWLHKQQIPSITIVNNKDIPFEHIFGKEVGKAMQAIHESNGVKFCNGASAIQFEGKNGAVDTVVLSDKKKLPAQLVIVALGATCNTEFVKSDPNIAMAADGGIVVDSYLTSSAPGLFAAGDIASYPVRYIGGDQKASSDDNKVRGRIEHWCVAEDHGRTVARNMLGQNRPHHVVPYFWSMQFAGTRFCGFAPQFDEVIIDGNPGNASNRAFVAYYIRGNSVCAVASQGRDPAVSMAAELFRANRMISVEQLRKGDFNLASRLP